MGFGGTGGNDHPVEIFFPDNLGERFLGILGTGIQVGVDILHIGQGGGVFRYCFDVDHTGDVDTAVTDENPDPGPFIDHIGLRYHLFFMNQGSPGLAEDLSGGGSRCTGIHHRLRDILGALESTAGIDPRTGGFHRFEGIGFAKIASGGVDTEFFGQFEGLRVGLKPDGQYHHIKDFGLDFPLFRNITKREVVAVMERVDGMDPAPDEPDALLLGPVVKSFEILAVGPDVHIKNGTFQVISGMLLCDNRFLDGIHAANRRAIGIVATVEIPGPHTLEPRHLFGFLVIRQPDQVPAGGAGGRQDPFHLHGGDHVGVISIFIGIETGWIEGFETGGQYHGTDF